MWFELKSRRNVHIREFAETWYCIEWKRGAWVSEQKTEKEIRRGKGRGRRERRVSWGPVSIYVNYRGGRKSRSPRCSVGKVGKGWLAFPEPTRARWIKAVINYAIIQTTLPPYVFEIKTVFFASMRITLSPSSSSSSSWSSSRLPRFFESSYLLFLSTRP